MRKFIQAIMLAMFFIAIAALLRTPNTDMAEMTAKYTNEFSQFVDNGNGLRIHYRDQGNPNGTPLVLLHGNSASLHTWEPLIDRLGEQYRIITYTHPGHGLTGPNADHDYSYAGMKLALDLIVDALGLDRFVLGGNSMGGWISWRYAVDHPEKIDALILLDASGMPLRADELEPKLPIGFRLLQSPIGRALAEHYAPRRFIKNSVLQSVSKQDIVTAEMVDRYWELLRIPGNQKAAALRFTIDRELAMADRVAEIDAPTLIIWGEDDNLINVTAATTFDEHLNNARVIIYPDIGHLPMEEAPDAVARDIDEFLVENFANSG